MNAYSITSTFLITTTLCIAALMLVPITISSSNKTSGPSPYLAEIDELHEIASKGLPPDAPEWTRLEELRLKNNNWFESQESDANDMTITRMLSLKSSTLSPFIAMLWAAAIYRIGHKNYSNQYLVLALGPITLYLIGVFSVIAVSLTVVAMIVVQFALWFTRQNNVDISNRE